MVSWEYTRIQIVASSKWTDEIVFTYLEVYVCVVSINKENKAFDLKENSSAGYSWRGKWKWRKETKDIVTVWSQKYNLKCFKE